MEHQQAPAHHDEHPPTTIRQYIVIGLILAVITVVELALTEAMDLPFRTLVVLLIFLSAIKFAIVVALFMHLKFDHPILSRLFMSGLVLGGSLLIALIAIFGADSTIIGNQGVVAAAPGHGDEEGTPPAEGEGAPAGDPAEGQVQGTPVADFFQASCAVCHGADRAGVTGLGLPLRPADLTDADDVYHDTIKNGRPGTAMPAWAQTAGLTDADIDALVQYIKHVEP